MTHESREAVKEQVRAHYGDTIRGRAGSSCCGTPGTRERELYGGALDALPDGLQTPSFGCGNPFAIAGLQRGEVVLDLGSGAGLDALLAARLVGEDGRVCGLDMTDDMLAVAQENARKAGARNVVLLKGDIESIPLPNESVDVIISNCVVNLAPSKQRAAAEAFRVLRRGGRFAISDIVVDGDLTGFPLDERQIRAAMSWPGCIASALTTTEVRAIFGDAGFTDLKIDILQRYSRQRLAHRLPDEIASLPDAIVRRPGRTLRIEPDLRRQTVTA